MTPHTLLFDIEADGLLGEATKIHCIAAVDPDKGTKYVWGPNEVENAVERLSACKFLVAHNGLRYDYPLLRRLTNWPRVANGPTCWDSMVLTRLIKSNQKDIDHRQKILPGKLVGSHSLEAWGQRLGRPKMHYDGPWGEWSQAMQDYCVADVETLLAIWQHLDVENYSEKAIHLEHDVSFVCAEMERSGWLVDVEKAGALHATLLEEKHRRELILKDQFGTWWESAGEFTPKANNARLGYTKGIPLTKIKEVEFNPASTQHRYKKLMGLGWKPKVYTESGQPKVDEQTLTEIAEEYPEAESLAQLMVLNKRIGQLATGNNAWLRLIDDSNYLHPAYNTNGTVTGRSSHFSPNIAQVPSVAKPYGKECRELFTVPPGFQVVGGDQAGLEQRCLAHYTSRYDNGNYAKKSLEGDDIHWEHAVAIGIAGGDEEGEKRKLLRAFTKTWFYAYVYGASDRKLTSVLKDCYESCRREGIAYYGIIDGTESRSKFGERIPALETLRQSAMVSAKKNGYLKGLDGRKIDTVDKEYKALNYLCQSAGAIICKQWLKDTYTGLLLAGYKYGYDHDFTILGWIHDELQLAVRKELVTDVQRIIEENGRGAGEPYGFRVPLEVDTKTGQSWADTH